jgi:hypothetical protein
MINIKKGDKIWIELEAKEDMKRDDQEMLWKIYGGKIKIDSFETASIIWNDNYFRNAIKEELTKKLLELKLLDVNLLNNMALNGGGIE